MAEENDFDPGGLTGYLGLAWETVAAESQSVQADSTDFLDLALGMAALAPWETRQVETLPVVTVAFQPVEEMEVGSVRRLGQVVDQAEHFLSLDLNWVLLGMVVLDTLLTTHLAYSRTLYITLSLSRETHWR